MQKKLIVARRDGVCISGNKATEEVKDVKVSRLLYVTHSLIFFISAPCSVYWQHIINEHLIKLKSQWKNSFPLIIIKDTKIKNRLNYSSAREKRSFTIYIITTKDGMFFLNQDRKYLRHWFMLRPSSRTEKDRMIKKVELFDLRLRRFLRNKNRSIDWSNRSIYLTFRSNRSSVFLNLGRCDIDLIDKSIFLYQRSSLRSLTIIVSSVTKGRE